MNERLPYEDHLQQHWADLPLPDENKAWEDMRRRLQEDDDDRPIIAWWRRGCLLWGLLLLVIFGSGLWLIKKKYFTQDDKREDTVARPNETSDKKRNDTLIIQTIPNNTGVAQKITKDETHSLKEIPGRQQTNPGHKSTSVNDPGGHTRSIPSSQEKGNQLLSRTPIQNPEVSGRRRNGNISTNNTNISKPVIAGRRKVVANTPRNPVTQPLRPLNNRTDKKYKAPIQSDKKPVEDDALTNNPPVINGSDTFRVKPVKDTPGIKAPDRKDSVAAIIPDKKDSLFRNTGKKDSTKKKQLTYSAGISMQQLLPIAGQKTVPYNSQGRKGTLADYIPSFYFRVNKEQKWFIQGEFKYGAPQYTREFVYKQERREDTLSPTQTFTTRTSNTLKKTYYHQLPVTFNYFLTKEWSVGAGLSWNKFVSAISDQEITRRNNSTTIDSLVSKGIVREKNDSATGFAKSYFQGVIESQYKWKRFSIGARYTFGLQPYLKFTLLNGETGKESNRSLQLFLRYELWQSKKKD